MAKYKTYTYYQIQRMTDAEVRKAYNLIRPAAAKRVKRLRSAGFGGTEIEYSGIAPHSRGIATEYLRDYLGRLSRFMQDPRSTLTGARSYEKNMKSTLASHGYNIQNLANFGRFMESMRERYNGAVVPPSDLTASIYEESERLGISQKTIEKKYGKYMKDRESAEKLLQAMRESKGRGVSSKALKEAFADGKSNEGNEPRPAGAAKRGKESTKTPRKSRRK